MRVKPKPSWIGVPNSAVMMISSEKPLRAVRHLRGDDADRLEREEAGEDELERAGVFALVGIEIEIAAAAYDAGVDRKADAVRRLEAERQIDRAEVLVGRRRRTRWSRRRPSAPPTAVSGPICPVMAADVSRRERTVLVDLEDDVERFERGDAEALMHRDGDLEAAGRLTTRPSLSFQPSPRSKAPLIWRRRAAMPRKLSESWVPARS